MDIYGEGELDEEIKAFSRKCKARVELMGTLPNDKLPGILNKYKYYVIPSEFEGMPKTLLEAMACGLVCIGTNVNGINEVIKDGVNGFLAQGTTAEDLLPAINRAVANNNKEIVLQAIDTIRDKFTLQAILEQEERIILTVTAQHKDTIYGLGDE